jgi:hypothetical protein
VVALISTLRRSGAATVVALAGLVMILTACTQTTPGAAVAAEPGPLPPPEITIFELDGLLLTTAEMESATGLSSLRVAKGQRTKMWDDSPGADKPECIGALFPLQVKSYEGAQWNVVRGAMLNDAPSPGEPFAHSVIQGVVRFADPEAAQQYWQKAASEWKSCNGEMITTRSSSGRPTPWLLEDAEQGSDTLTVKQSPVGNPGAGCLRALRAHSNVAIDVMVCGSDLTDEATAITGAIAEGMPQL